MKFLSSNKKEATPTEPENFESNPILKSPKEEYPSLDSEITQNEHDIMLKIREDKQDILSVLPKEIADDGKTFDPEAWLMEDSNLIRFVRARNCDYQNTKKAVIKTLKWRIEYRPHAIKLSEVEIELRTGKSYFNGFDLHGRPILYFRPHLENTKDPENQIRLVVFQMELAEKLFPKGASKLVIIIDVSKLSLSNSVSPKTATKFLEILQSHYPERLGKGVIVNPPSIFVLFYRMVSPFIDPVTKNKISFVDTKKQKPSSDAGSINSSATWLNMSELFDLDILESSVSGRFNYKYNHRAYLDSVLSIL
ncbi:hypothetical protein BB560_002475 [Smittium megazygosporum]|uniref:CRAL-TRIO domain-containing protein n=1 Tax=Smittium megazygosporum TaxID=133381 RepID=A0A2T9Z9S3_9FUNG|nr:hypothetical protein BB560_004226 [Smittium megazygosporum]PVV03056.1 hypothetical protein BB560_002475 [Smittium megazygosporum]